MKLLGLSLSMCLSLSFDEAELTLETPELSFYGGGLGLGVRPYAKFLCPPVSSFYMMVCYTLLFVVPRHLFTSSLSTQFSPVAEDDPEVLDRPKCLAALASLRHAKWFQVRLICCML